MTLPDGPRQILAAVLAAIVFLGLYFGMSLIWWAALAGAVLVYFALLLIVRRRTPADEIKLAGTVTAADIEGAGRTLLNAANRLDTARESVPEGDRPHIASMAANLRKLQNNIAHDPQDFRNARRFIVSMVPVIVDTVEAYGQLAVRAGSDHGDRLDKMGADIRGLAPVVEQITQATLDNDFDALEIQISAVATQMTRGYIRK